MRVAAALFMVVLLSGCAGEGSFHDRLYTFAHAGQGAMLDTEFMSGPLQSPAACRATQGRAYSADEQRKIRELCVRPQVASADTQPKGVTKPVIALASR